jgi:hypothetical protein
MNPSISLSVNPEALRLRHKDISGTHMKENVHRWKLLPEEWSIVRRPNMRKVVIYLVCRTSFQVHDHHQVLTMCLRGLICFLFYVLDGIVVSVI